MINYIATDKDIEFYKSCGLSLVDRPNEYDGTKFPHVFMFNGNEIEINAINENQAWAICSVTLNISTEIK